MSDFWNTVVQILVSALAAGVCAFLAFIWKELKNSDFFSRLSSWIENKIGVTGNETLDKVIDQFTAAADQLVKAGELVKEDRLTYVEDRLKDLEVEMSDVVRAKIEASVSKLPAIEVKDK